MVSELAMYPVLAIAMTALDYRVTKKDNVLTNGYGGLWAVIRKEAKFPSRYRVLVPWAFWCIHRLLGGENDPPESLPIYLFLKWALMSSAMMVAGYFFSPVIALMLALWWMLLLQYDYWDVYAEALAFLLVLTGDVRFAAIGVVIGALGRETTIILPFVFLAAGGGLWTILVAGLWIAVVAAVYQYQGMYPDGTTWKLWFKPHNCAFHFVWERRPWRRFLIMGWGIIAVSIVVMLHYQSMPEPFRSTVWVMPVMCVACFFGGLIHEPRILSVNAIWWGALLI